MESLLNLRLPPQAQSVPAGRRAVRALAGLVPEPVVESCELVVTELLSNSVRHAGLDPEQRIEVRLAACGQDLRLEVEDPGCGFAGAVPAPPDPSTPATGGYGLHLVDTLCARWGVRTGATTSVWCEGFADK